MVRKLFFTGITLFLMVLLFNQCTFSDKVNVSDIKIDLKIKRFEMDLFENDNTVPSKIAYLNKNYPEFFHYFNELVISMGNTNSDVYVSLLNEFMHHYTVQKAYKDVKNAYDDISDVTQTLIQGFKHYKYYFPESNIPDIVTFVSGFSQSIRVSDEIIAISLEKYLGADYEMYKRLKIPEYISINMNRQKLVPDCFTAWFASHHPFNDSIDNVLSHMVYQGVMLYSVKKMLPDVNDTSIFGFTSLQLQFCEKNIEKMWAFLIEYNKLFSTDRLDIKKLIEDAPFTADFTNASPGRAACWIGWRIVDCYMKNNEVSLNELLENNKYMEIYNQARFIP